MKEKIQRAVSIQNRRARFDYELLDAFIHDQLDEKRDIASFWRPKV